MEISEHVFLCTQQLILIVPRYKWISFFFPSRLSLCSWFTKNVVDAPRTSFVKES